MPDVFLGTTVDYSIHPQFPQAELFVKGYGNIFRTKINFFTQAVLTFHEFNYYKHLIFGNCKNSLHYKNVIV